MGEVENLIAQLKTVRARRAHAEGSVARYIKREAELEKELADLRAKMDAQLKELDQ